MAMASKNQFLEVKLRETSVEVAINCFLLQFLCLTVIPQDEVNKVIIFFCHSIFISLNENMKTAIYEYCKK